MSARARHCNFNTRIPVCTIGSFFHFFRVFCLCVCVSFKIKSGSHIQAVIKTRNTGMVAHQCHSILCCILTFFLFFNNFSIFCLFFTFFIVFFYSINKKKTAMAQQCHSGKKKKKKKKKQPWPRSAIAHDALRRSSHQALGLKQHGGADKKRYVEM